MHAPVEQLEQQLDDCRAHAGMAEGEHVGAQQRDGPRLVPGQRRAHTRSVAADQVELQLADALRGNHHLRQRPEARGQAVDDAVLGDRALHDGAGGLDAHAGHCGQGHVIEGRPGDALDLLEREAAAQELDVGRHGREDKAGARGPTA